MVPGMRYVAEYLSPDAHDALLAAVDGQPWQEPSYIGRRVQVYGYTYHHTRGGISYIGHLPPWVTALSVSLVRDGLMPSPPDQMVANEYPAGAGIRAHVDDDSFDDAIVSISLGSSCVMELSRNLAGSAEPIFLEPRSALVLAGEARHSWLHAIPARASDVWQGVERPRGRRVSLTFRTMLPDRIVG